MNLSIKGTVKAVLPLESGTSKSGNAWQKGGFVITTDGQYPKDVAFTLFGEDKVKLCPQVGEEVDVHFDLSSREYKSRWYSEISAYRIERAGQQGAAKKSQPAPQPQPTQSQPQGDGGDLPF